MSVIDQAVESIEDRLGHGAPTELVEFIRTHLERMYVLGRIDAQSRQRTRDVDYEAKLRAMHEKHQRLVKEQKIHLQLIEMYERARDSERT